MKSQELTARHSNITELSSKTTVRQLCTTSFAYGLVHYADMQVNHVPSVMHQVLVCSDSRTDVRFHVALSGTGAYVHDHKASFTTLCLKGGYKEKIWKVRRSDTLNDF